ncbi:hypothetical protein P3T73_00455 [Kiritimatiellota bacterium B12222]|nr:hypothetical protein P3T73_00455 [Kiritimatiellota bacterium B12222]
MKCRLSTSLTLASFSLLTLSCTTPMPPPSSKPLKLSLDHTKTFQLSQPWYDHLEFQFRRGEANLQWSPEALIVHAELSDDEVYTASDADNQHMWELGDVFEVFLQIEGQEDYVELHITPANTRFQAHKPNVPGNDASGEWKPIEHWLISPIGFSAEATTITDGWIVSMEIPPSVLGLSEFTPGTELRVAFARYDGAPHREPTLSTTATHARSETVTFHIPTDWHPILLQN